MKNIYKLILCDGYYIKLKFNVINTVKFKLKKIININNLIIK
jgi:hypothetical protein